MSLAIPGLTGRNRTHDSGSLTIIKITSFNLLDYGDDPDDKDRRAEIERVIRTTDPHILAVQEILSSGRDWKTGPGGKAARAEQNLRQLADATNLNCYAPEGPALAIGRGRRHVGLLYRDGVELVPGTLLCCNTGHYNVQNGMVSAVFKVNGRQLRVGSAHMPVRDPGSWEEAGVVLYAFDRPIAGVCCGDWQSIGLHDPDPYDGVPWHRAFAYQLDRDGKPTRDVAIRLEQNGRFKDCARVVGAGFTPTTGHHPADPHQIAPRQIDRIYGTEDLPDEAIVGHEVTSLELLNNASDHRPVSVLIDETKLPD